MPKKQKNKTKKNPLLLIERVDLNLLMIYISSFLIFIFNKLKNWSDRTIDIYTLSLSLFLALPNPCSAINLLYIPFIYNNMCVGERPVPPNIPGIKVAATTYCHCCIYIWLRLYILYTQQLADAKFLKEAAC